MRLPEDYNDHSGLTPTVFSAIVAVTLFVGVILAAVLLINNQRPARAQTNKQKSVFAEETEGEGSSVDTGELLRTDEILTGSTLSPDDLDFWDLYPEETAQAPEPEKESVEETVENDPASDGKHTLIKYADGEEEWLLISPYLPKHEYDFTKLVYQSNLMKYYEEGNLVSFVGADISKNQDYVDFVELKKAGVDYVMLRVGARGYGSGQLVLDEYFADNIRRASDAGLEIGVYFSSQAITTDEAVEEANMVLENIRDYSITYPVAFRMESVENDEIEISYDGIINEWTNDGVRTGNGRIDFTLKGKNIKFSIDGKLSLTVNNDLVNALLAVVPPSVTFKATMTLKPNAEAVVFKQPSIPLLE